MKIMVLALLLIASVGWGLFEASQNQRFKSESAAWKQDRAELEEWRSKEPEMQKLKTQAAQVETLKKQSEELNRLRNETRSLRDFSNQLSAARSELIKLRAAMNAPKPSAPEAVQRGIGIPMGREQWAFGGYSSPEAAFETTLWAGRELNAEAYLNAFAPELRGKLEKDIQTNGFEEHIKKRFTNLNNATLLGKTAVSSDQVDLQYQVDGWNEGKPFIQSMKNVNGEWKVSGAPKYQ